MKDYFKYRNETMPQVCTCGHLQLIHAGQNHSGPCQAGSNKDRRKRCTCDVYTFGSFIMPKEEQEEQP